MMKTLRVQQWWLYINTHCFNGGWNPRGKVSGRFLFPPWAQVAGPVIIPGTDHFRMLPMLGRHQRGKTRSREDRPLSRQVCGSNHTSGWTAQVHSNGGWNMYTYMKTIEIYIYHIEINQLYR